MAREPVQAYTSPEVATSTAPPVEGCAAPMQVYSLNVPTKEEELVLLGSAEILGGRTLEGDMQIYARVDYSEKGKTAGLFKATAGKVAITFPFNEHGTILEGTALVTDETGQTHTLTRGDSYFIRKGQTVILNVQDNYILKTFFNTVE